MSAGVPTDGGAGAKALPVRGVRLGPRDSEEAGVAGAQGGSQEMALGHGKGHSARDKSGLDVS